MADHPLRPATDRSLGGPLPHQLANPTRAPPAAINLSPGFPRGACGISRSFPRLSPTTGQVPTRYSPVRHSRPAETGQAFDLHVLGMPPAFVLSQDQTLKFIPGRSHRIDRSQGPPKRSLRCTNARRAPRRRPRIPSFFSTLSINPTPRLRPQRGRAYRPSATNRQHPKSAVGAAAQDRGKRLK